MINKLINKLKKPPVRIHKGEDNLFLGLKDTQMDKVALELTKDYGKSTFIISSQYQWKLRNSEIPKGTEIVLVPYDYERDHHSYLEDYRHKLNEIVRLNMVPELIILENCPFNIRSEYPEFARCTILYIYHSGTEMHFLKYYDGQGIVVFRCEDAGETFRALFNRNLTRETIRDIASLNADKHIYLSNTFGNRSSV